MFVNEHSYFLKHNEYVSNEPALGHQDFVSKSCKSIMSSRAKTSYQKDY